MAFSSALTSLMFRFILLPPFLCVKLRDYIPHLLDQGIDGSLWKSTASGYQLQMVTADVQPGHFDF
jgi:hypothetical protein